MAVPTSNLSISNLHTEVGGGASAEASLDDLDIRAFGNAYALPTHNVGTAGVPLTQGTEIALGEFRGASIPSVTYAFNGTYTHRYNVYSGGQYAPTTVGDEMTSMSVQSFTGLLMGVNATHTIRVFENDGLSAAGGGTNSANQPAGSISLSIENNIPSSNTAGSYTNTGWSHIQFGYYGNNSFALSLYRNQAASFYASPYSSNHYVTYTWGGSQPYIYTYATYFGAVNHYTNQGAYRTYHSSTQVFRMVL